MRICTDYSNENGSRKRYYSIIPDTNFVIRVKVSTVTHCGRVSPVSSSCALETSFVMVLQSMAFVLLVPGTEGSGGNFRLQEMSQKMTARAFGVGSFRNVNNQMLGRSALKWLTEIDASSDDTPRCAHVSFADQPAPARFLASQRIIPVRHRAPRRRRLMQFSLWVLCDAGSDDMVRISLTDNTSWELTKDLYDFAWVFVKAPTLIKAVNVRSVSPPRRRETVHSAPVDRAGSLTPSLRAGAEKRELSFAGCGDACLAAFHGDR